MEVFLGREFEMERLNSEWFKSIARFRHIKIGIDVDSVVAETTPEVLVRINKKYGFDLKKSDIVDWNMRNDRFILYDEIMEMFEDKQSIRTIPPVRGAASSIRMLINDFTIKFITTRPDKYADDTRWWISTYIFDADKRYKNIEIAHVEKDKNGVGVDILVDDNMGNIYKFASVGKPAILFNQPWNSKKSFYEHVSNHWRDWDDLPIYRSNGWFSRNNGTMDMIYELALKYYGDM